MMYCAERPSSAGTSRRIASMVESMLAKPKKSAESVTMVGTIRLQLARILNLCTCCPVIVYFPFFTIRAMIVSPAVTWSPIFATISMSSLGKYISRREPNFIMPKRSPCFTVVVLSSLSQ